MKLRITALVTAMVLAYSACICSAAEVNTSYNKITTDVIVSGELPKTAASSKLIMYCIKNSTSADEIPAESDVWQSTDVIAAMGYTTADENGAYVFPTVRVNGESADYRFYVTSYQSDKIFSSELVHIAAKSDTDGFVADISGKTAAEIAALLDGEVSDGKIGLEIPIYKMLGNSAKMQAAEALAGRNYADIEEVEKEVNKASVLPAINNVENGLDFDKLLFPDGYEDVKPYADIINENNGMSAEMSLSTFTALGKLAASERIAVLNAALAAKGTNTITDKISACQITREIANAEGYGDIDGILAAHKDVLTMFDFTKYNASKYKNDLNKELLKQSFTATADIAKFAEDYIAARNTATPAPNPGSGGGGGGGTGGTKISDVVKPNVTPQPKPEKKTFADMKYFGWAADAVNYLCERKIISGRSETEFAPQDGVTREEFVTMMVLAFSVYDENAVSRFDDVASGAWYASYVASGVNAGIISGVTDALFAVGEPITRQDIAVIAARAKKAQISDGETGFSDDGDIADYARGAVKYMKDNGYISGYEDGSFRPRRGCTRAEAAKIIYDLIK